MRLFIFCTCLIFTVLSYADFHEILLFRGCSFFLLWLLVVIADVIIIIALAKGEKKKKAIS